MGLVRLLAATLAAAATFAAPVSHAQPSFTYDATLRTLARETLERVSLEQGTSTHLRRMGVRCYATGASFERAFERRFGLSARKVIAYYAGGNDMHLRGRTCDNVRLFMAGSHSLFTSASFSILLHEALHRQGLRNERLTTCFANEAVRWGAEWLGFTRQQALRARNLAFSYTRRYTPSAYFMGRPTCLAVTRRTAWRDHAARR